VLESAVAGVSGFVARGESAGSVQVERGTILPATLSGNPDVHAVDRLIELAVDGQPANIAVVDAGGHQRPVYRPLLIYCWLLAYENLPLPAWTSPLRRWCELARKSAGSISSTERTKASNGGAITESVWCALAIFVAGELFHDPGWRDAGHGVMIDLCEHQQPSGAFLIATASDNPETFWYHELILLHAVASFAAWSGDARPRRSAMCSAAFHLNETQPDHATSQPWGLPAFVRYAPMLADQMLHTMTTQQPAGIDGVSLMLLADTLQGLQRSGI
jgi:hypothetical protein